jgi:hypothetical protein
MKAVMAWSIPSEFAAEFTPLIRRFDELHAGCCFQIVADAALPTDLRPIFAKLAPGFPIIDPRKFDRESDQSPVCDTPVKRRLRPSSRKT